jgi:hypothetical protein
MADAEPAPAPCYLCTELNPRIGHRAKLVCSLLITKWIGALDGKLTIFQSLKMEMVSFGLLYFFLQGS